MIPLSRVSLLSACAVLLVSACGRSDRDEDDSAKAAASATPAVAPAAAPSTAAPAPAATPALTDANVLALLDNANAADSASGAIAQSKASSAEVRAFGADMQRDHHALRKAGQDLAKRLNITPEMPAGDNSVAAATAWQDSLRALPKGTAFDKAYVQHEVTYHEALLKTAQAGLDAAQNPELRAFIQKAAPSVEAHLKHAQQIWSKLGS